MTYRVFSLFQWIHVDGNILETMPRKTEEKKIVLVRVDKALVWLSSISPTTAEPPLLPNVVGRWGGYRQLLVVIWHCLSSEVILARPSCVGLGSGRDWEAEAVRGYRRGEVEGIIATLPAFSLQRSWTQLMRISGRWVRPVRQAPCVTPAHP